MDMPGDAGDGESAPDQHFVGVGDRGRGDAFGQVDPTQRSHERCLEFGPAVDHGCDEHVSGNPAECVEVNMHERQGYRRFPH